MYDEYVLHDIDDAKIEWGGDTLSNPLHLEDGNLMKFQVIVANPPFSLDKWAMGFAGDNDDKFKMEASLDPHGRFEWGEYHLILGGEIMLSYNICYIL